MKQYLVFPTAKKVHKCRCRIKYISGPVGQGKTTIAFMDLYLLAKRNAKKGFKESIFYIIRQTYPQLRDSTLHSFFELFDIDRKRFNWNRHELEMKVGKHRIMWRFRSLTEALKDLEKIGGYIATAFYIDEATEYSERAILDRCNMRTRYPSSKIHRGKWVHAEHMIILTSNPPEDKEHWLWDLFFVNNPAPEIFCGFIQSDDENPKLPPDYYENLHKTLPAFLRQRYLQGRPTPIPTGAEVYRNFVYDKNVKKIEPFHGYLMLRGWDFGTANPACVLGQILCFNRVGKPLLVDEASIQELMDAHYQLRVYDEICHQNLTAKALAEIVKNYCQVKYPGFHWMDFCDPSGYRRTETGQRGSVLQLVEAGIRPVPGAQDVRTRILAVQNFLDLEDGLIVDPSCKRVVTGFEGGYHKVKIKGIVIEKITKNKFSHPHDALQYLVSAYFLILKERVESHKKTKSSNIGKCRVV